jgi:hypothetical protein
MGCIRIDEIFSLHALPLLIAWRKICFLAAVRDRNYISWLFKAVSEFRAYGFGEGACCIKSTLVLTIRCIAILNR